jgi:uncharacterized protein (DUF2147 family)
MRFLIGWLALFFSAATLAATSPLGYWKTVDDISGRVQSIIQIYETPDHTIAGKILKTFPKPGVAPLVTCNLCEGALHDQPVIGMSILKNLHPDKDNQWTGGTIVDPKTGKVYHCFITLEDNGNQLTIRGYIVFHWLGRSQTWFRTNAPKAF